MPLSRNEIRTRAIAFVHDWSDPERASREKGEAQTFWNEFFGIFGVSRRKVASFEAPVKNLTGDTEFIDLFWKGRLIAEHKSRGKNLAKAHTQAVGYIQNLINEGRGEEVPRYILVSDFANFALYDLEAERQEDQTLRFVLADLPAQLRAFDFVAGYETRRVDPEDPANLKAVELLGNLHDQLEAGGYTNHALERFLVRILFCLFADDTGIFGDPDVFRAFVEQRTAADGSDMGVQLARFFEVLNTPRDRRQAHLDEDLAALPYVNGELFAERLTFADFNSAMRVALLQCCAFRWNRISPHIFGALFQAVMQPRERRQIGAHYTSERDILKLVRSLFLDDLEAQLEKAKHDRPALRRLHDKLAGLRFLDPACGCGNFLILAYRELRRLEITIIRRLYPEGPSEGDVRAECRVDVDQMYGIEIEEWPARIAEVAMWLMDHQMNQEVFRAFGKPLMRLPLTKSAKIVIGNALRMDWREVLPAETCAYVMGNPPFVGKKARSADQVADMDLVFGGHRGSGVLDYVCCWYMRATEYMARNEAIRAAFVSTNSITQGEQPGVLWGILFPKRIKIAFGHRTFAWESEARGRAHVHVVILGLARELGLPRPIYDYERNAEQPEISTVGNISPYLVAGGDWALQKRQRPLSDVPQMQFGNMPNDGGHLLLDETKYKALMAEDRKIARYIRPFISAKEFLHGIPRWCLWLEHASPGEVANLPVLRRVTEAVRVYRQDSRRTTTRDLASMPWQFGEIRQPDTDYVLLPRHSSETRDYIPLAFFSPTHIVADSCLFIPSASLYHFGVLSSLMHMAWVRQVCGRIKSDFRYSGRLVYNNFPWPASPTEAQRDRVNLAVQEVMDARKDYPEATLDDLYDPIAMPSRLVRAHRKLNQMVDRCYRPQRFDNDRQRVEYLFELHARLTAPLTAAPRPRPRRAKHK